MGRIKRRVEWKEEASEGCKAGTGYLTETEFFHSGRAWGEG